MRKGDLSMSTIVMAAIAILVLIILASFVLRAGGNVAEAQRSCVIQGGVCSYEPCGERIDTFRTRQPQLECYIGSGSSQIVDRDQYCCIAG